MNIANKICALAFMVIGTLMGVYNFLQNLQKSLRSLIGDGIRWVKCLVANINDEAGTKTNGCNIPKISWKAAALVLLHNEQPNGLLKMSFCVLWNRN